MIVSRKQKIINELNDIVNLCVDVKTTEESPFYTIGRIQAMAEKALGYMDE